MFYFTFFNHVQQQCSKLKKKMYYIIYNMYLYAINLSFLNLSKFMLILKLFNIFINFFFFQSSKWTWNIFRFINEYR